MGGKGGGGGSDIVRQGGGAGQSWSGGSPSGPASYQGSGVGGGASPSAGTSPVRSASSDPTAGSTATGQKDFGYTDKMKAAIAKAVAIGAVKGLPFGPVPTVLSAAWEGYKERRTMEGEMSQKGRFGKPTISARPGGYKSLLGDDDNDNDLGGTGLGEGEGGWGATGIGERGV